MCNTLQSNNTLAPRARSTARQRRSSAERARSDEIETALAFQMACTHMAAMAVMSRISGAGGGPQRLPGLASASAKLLRAFCNQVETYRRLRGGGEQKHPR